MKITSMVIVVGAALCAERSLAQFNLAGTWAQLVHEDQGERGGGPRIGDYTGLPINDAARLRADTWSPDRWTVPEHQCEPHPIDYAPLGPASMLITADHDPVSYNVIAWHLTFSWMNTTQTIWMDGREHPPEQAPRTWMGHSVGRWEGDILVVDISHVKEGWIRRNGVPRSDLAQITQYWILHQDILQLVTAIDDPVYLEEPSVRSVAWQAHTGYRMGPYPCSARVEIDRPRGFVPHYLPGANPLLREFTEDSGIPWEATRGGAEQMYPEYQEVLQRLIDEDEP